jgi:GTP-binding protein EngB required for normal cell division
MHTESQAIGGESTAVDAPVEALRRVPVKGFARLAAFLRGKEILIVGPGNAGKSKFAQYLRFAALDPEGVREMTYALTKSPTFVLGVGGEEGFELKVRRTVDTCGQVGPLQHALLVARRQPHAVIIILDCGADPRSMLRWLCLFCDALDSILRKLPSARRRLQEIVVILNKRDKIDDGEFAKLHQAVRKALERFLTVVWGAHRIRAIPIVECISVWTERGTALIDGVIAQLAERLGGRQDRSGTAVGQRIVAVSPAGPHPGPSGLLGRPAATPSSPPAGQQDQPGAMVGPRPVAVWSPRFHPRPPRPSQKPAPRPSFGPEPPAAPAPAP